MNNKWGDKEAQKSAQDLVSALSLKEACLKAVPEYFQDDREPSEILGEIFVALKRVYPNEYHVAFKKSVTRRCKDCDANARRRGYCDQHYQKHYRAGDFEAYSRY